MLLSLRGLDELTPSNRVELLLVDDSRGSLRQAVHLSLVSLFAIDEILSELLPRSTAYYLLDDSSLVNVIRECVLAGPFEADVETAVVLLTYAQLIYRFPTAKRFGASEASRSKQLRLNSWGREYTLFNQLLRQEEMVYHSLRRWLASYISARRASYDSLRVILAAPLCDSSAAELQRINSNLQLKLVC